MIINKTIAAILGAIVLACGAASTAQAGIRGILSVYNQSTNPYHVYVEGQRIGTVYQGQTLRVPVNDWHGSTELVAIQAGSNGHIRFVRHVRTCQFARWELHAHGERLAAYGGSHQSGPHHGHVGPHHGHGGQHHWHGHPHHGHGHPHRGGAPTIRHGIGMVVRGTDPHNPRREADLAGGIVSIIAGAIK